MTRTESAETAHTTNSKIRLNKFIAMSGFTSRRKADDLIKSGKVQINGEVITRMGVEIHPEKDHIEVNGIQIKNIPSRSYYILNKPKGYICANHSTHGEKLITDLLPNIRLSTVGRLDKHTTGLLIATNDGEFLNQLAHPSYKCEKEYLVKIKRKMPQQIIEKLQNGIEIEVEKIKNGEKSTQKHFAKPLKVEVMKNQNNLCVLTVTIGEGKKRQIRLMMQAIGYRFIDLKRIRVGTLKLGELESGTYRELTSEEIDSLRNSSNS